MTEISTMARPLHALQTAVDRARSMRTEGLSRRAVESASLSLLDWMGCAVAGAGTAEAQQMRSALAPSAGESVVVGTGLMTGWRDAIVLNGVHGHALDFDDMLPSLSGHPSAAVFPALLALGSEADVTVARLHESYLAGVEIASWVARYVMPEHYEAGWHGTGTIGAFAAAGAVARLLDLDRDKWVTALDLAATQTAGLRELFGTTGKPLHAANAAQAGAVAALMAQAGAQSDGRGVLGERGFLAIHGGDLAEVGIPELGPWAAEGTLYKTYASCYMTQAAVDAALQLRSDRSPADRIDRITITASPKLRDVCSIPDPRTGSNAKFSLHAAVGLALVGHDMAAEDTYRSEVLVGVEYQALRSRIQLEFDDELVGQESHIILRTTLNSGAILVHDADRGRPAEDVDHLRSTLRNKFTGLVSPTLGLESAEHLAEMAENRGAAVRALLAASQHRTGSNGPNHIRHKTIRSRSQPSLARR